MRVDIITAEQHLAYIASRSSVSFLQTPAWGKAKPGWTAMSLGWIDNDEIVGAGLLLMRKVPKVNRFLAYLPEGPDLNWSDPQLVERALAALVEFSQSKNVFQIKMGPHSWTRRWNAETLKTAIAEQSAQSIAQLAPDAINDSGTALSTLLTQLNWKQPQSSDSGFGDYQPRYVFQLDLKNKTEEEIFNGFNQLWRRNIRKSEKAGVTVRIGNESDLALFHECYVETAHRDGFTPRPLSYFETMWKAMREEAPERMQVFIAQHPDHDGAIAATTMTQVGDHAWYSYGASTTAARDLRPSNAIQWAMIRQSLADGCSIYDMRGISDTLSTENHLFGLIQFKLGTGGFAQEYVGEWDYVISPMWSRAFNTYMARR